MVRETPYDNSNEAQSQLYGGPHPSAGVTGEIYPPGVASIGQKWRESALSDLDWRRDPTRAKSISPGEAGGFVVEADSVPYPAYSKPTKPCPPDRPRAAYEKIAADLAYELKVRVPPVQMYRRNPCPSDEEECCCVSLVMYSEVYNLRQVHRLADPISTRIDSALSEGSGVVAFDAWIGNQDRSNRQNTLVAVDPQDSSRLRSAFIDHANAFNMRDGWEGGDWEDVSAASMPGRLRDAVDPDRVRDTVEAIEGMDGSLVEDIVNRVPDDFMSEDHGSVVLTGLLERRGLVREAVEQHL